MPRPSGVVALLTDFGLQDPYVGILKGVLLGANPKASIVDLSHDVPPQDVAEAARILAAAVPYFPDGTVFVSVVDPGVGSDRAVVGVETARHFFLAPDNGLLGALDGVRRRVRVSEERYFRKPVSRTFHGRDVFAPVAGRLSRGVDLGRFGPALRSIRTLEAAAPRLRTDGGLEGEIVSIDRFGNLITNIPGELLADLRGMNIRVGRRSLRALSRTYADARKGALLALVGSTGHLEISVNQGDARRVAGSRKGDRVLVTRRGR